MDRIERVVDVQRDPFGNRGEGLASRSTIALLIRSRARTSGKFSNRDIVDSEHNSRSMGERSSAIFNIVSRLGAIRRCLLVAGADHQQSKTDDVRQAVRDLIAARGSIMQAASRSATRSRCSTSRNARNRIDDSRPPSNLTTTGLPEADDRPGSGSIELFMADAAQVIEIA